MVYVTKENLENFCYTNEKFLKNPIKAITLDLHGCGETRQFNSDEKISFAEDFGNEGILMILPYYGPWSWMNDNAVRLVDQIIDAAIEKFDIDPSIPFISTGLSMGGHGVLTYTLRGKYKPSACVLNCPAVNPMHIMNQNPKLQSIFYSAYAHYNIPIEQAVKENAPITFAKDFPDIPYFIVQCTADEVVIKEHNSDLFVKLLKESGHHDITYYLDEGRGHTDLSPEARKAFADFTVKHALKK